jgi:hypothetical protein
LTRKKKPPVKPQSRDDAWLAYMEIECAKAGVTWLKQTVNTKRPICSLNMGEMRALAQCITSTWIGLAHMRVLDEPDSVEGQEYAYLLL